MYTVLHCTVQPIGMDPERGDSSKENMTDQNDLDFSCSSLSFDNSDAVEEPVGDCRIVPV